MGCTDRESNFQRLVFKDGQWGALWGMFPSWEGPVEELTKQFPEFHEPNFIRGDQAYSVERTTPDSAIIKPLGRIVLDHS